MKKRIMMAATGLSTSVLVATAVVNPKLVSDLMRIELVKAVEIPVKEINNGKERLYEDKFQIDLKNIISKEGNIAGLVKLTVESGNFSEHSYLNYNSNSKIVSMGNLMKKFTPKEENGTKTYLFDAIVEFTEEKKDDSGKTTAEKIKFIQTYEIIQTDEPRYKVKDEVEMFLGGTFKGEMLVEYAYNDLGAEIRPVITSIFNPINAGVYTVEFKLAISEKGTFFSSAKVIVKEHIDTLIPDPKLQQVIANALKTEVKYITRTQMGELTLDLLDVDGIYDLEGIQYLKDIDEVRFRNTAKNTTLLNEFTISKGCHVQNIGTADFDNFVGLSSNSQVTFDGQEINKELVTLDSDEIKVNLNDYVGKASFEKIEPDSISIKIDDETTNEFKYDPDNNTITVFKLKENSEFEYTNLNITFDETVNIFGENHDIQISINQPFAISSNPSNPGTEGGGSTGGTGDGSGSENSNAEKIDPINLMTDETEVDIYNGDGTKTGTRKLSSGTTDFKTEKMNTVKGVKYYEIGDNEWLKAEDVLEFHANDSYVQTHGDAYKELTKFGNKGTVKDRALDKTSDWYTDRYVYFQGKLHHRVSTHEWINNDHVVEYKSVSGTVHANNNAMLYNSSGQMSKNRGLAKGALFYTDKSATINGKIMYRVATDEWVDADEVTFK